jgi:hypothetical protein
MNFMSRKIAMILLLFSIGVVGLLAEPGEEGGRLEGFRQALDEKVKGVLERYDASALALQGNYLEALERLKLKYGREGNLRAAAQVLGEIKHIAKGERDSDISDDEDYGLAQLRKKWDESVEKIVEQKNEELSKISDSYVKMLEKEIGNITRGGRIEEALAFDAEVKRVEQLPEMKKAIAAGKGEVFTGFGEGRDLALSSEGAKVRGAEEGQYLIDGKVTDYREGNFAWGRLPSEFIVELKKVYTVDRVRMLLWDDEERQYKYILSVSKDGSSWNIIRDATKEGGSGWQEITFEPSEVRFVRIEGTGNTVNDEFHAVELEVYGEK